MINYVDEYFEKIYDGLSNLCITDNAGKEITREEGFDIWADRVLLMNNYNNGLTFFCGNGASASMAEHMSHDWFQNGKINTTTCGEISHVTAISNDIGYENVYAFRVERIISEKDIFVGISSSGNSSNIVMAAEAARKKGAFVITVTGKKKDNKLSKLGNLNFYIPLDTYGEVESAHAVLLHAALDYYMDKYLGGRH